MPPIPCTCTLPAEKIIAIMAVILAQPSNEDQDLKKIAAQANARVSEVLIVLGHIEQKHELPGEPTSRLAGPGRTVSGDDCQSSEERALVEGTVVDALTARQEAAARRTSPPDEPEEIRLEDEPQS